MASPFRLPEKTHIGLVHLRVKDLSRMLGFYEQLLGFRVLERVGNEVLLSSDEKSYGQFRLTESPEAKPRHPRAPGLFHTAIRLPNRKELAKVLHRFFSEGCPVGGFANHGVSEAVYLEDPEGNGVEVYADLPRDRWPKIGDQIAMTTDALDVDGLLAEYEKSGEAWNGIHPQTDIGHIHLQVSDLKKSESFYSDLLGFDVTQRSYPGALFVSAGGYHHHVGMNIWRSRGAAPPPPHSLGLAAFSIRLPEKGDVSIVREQIEKQSLVVIPIAAGFALPDPDGIRVEVES